MLIILAIPIVLMGSVYGLLYLPPVQQKIKDIALKEIMKKTHNQISIGNLYFHPFNQIRLQDVYANDLRGDTLLSVRELSAGFDLFRLTKNQLLIQSVNVEDFIIHINKDSLNSDFNFQFLIDAFESDKKDTTGTSPLQIQIKDVALKNGQIRYDIFSEPATGDSLMDFNHIAVSDFQTSLDLNSLDMSKLDIQIKQLVLVEKSGLDVRNLQAKITSEGEKMQLANLQIRFPNSQLIIPEASYTLPANGSEGYFEAKLGDNSLLPADFKMLYPGLADLPEKLTLHGEINGALPHIQIPLFQANYGNHIRLELAASILDYQQWQTSPMQLSINQLDVDNAGMEELMRFATGNTNPKLPVKLGAIHLNGQLQGNLADLSAQLTATTDRGSVHLDGTGGYDYLSGNSHFDVAANTGNFDVRTLLQDTLYGLASLKLQARGKISASEKLDIIGNAAIDRFDFKGYSYNRIEANGSYTGDSIYCNLYSDDNNVPLQINMLADMGEKTPGIRLSAGIDCVYLDTLNLLPDDYKDAFLLAKIRADIKGFNPEKMQVGLSVDSLTLITDKGTFNEPHFNLVYQANDSSRKQLDIHSHIVNAHADGMFTYTGLMEAIKETFPMLFPNSRLYPKKKDAFAENLNFQVGMNHVTSLSGILELPKTLPDSMLFIGKYNNDGKNMRLLASAYTQFTETDTLQLSVSLSNKSNNLALIFNVDNKSANYDFDGSIDTEITFIPKKGSLIPDMDIALNPTVLVYNETDFHINPAQIEVREGRYTVHNLLLSHSGNPTEYIRADGVVSASNADSLTVDISNFQLSTIFGAIETDVPFSGTINGRINAGSLLSTPLIFTRNFAVNNIMYAGNTVGDLQVNSGWSSEHNGLALQATLTRGDLPPSVVSGFVLPKQDSLSIRANIRDIELAWLQEMMNGTLYGLAGDLSADIQASGKMQNPTINGVAKLNHAQIGINQLNTLYSINDSITFNSHLIELNRFTILDENKNSLTATGTVTHDRFSGFNPNILLSISDFLVLNNARQTDSLFYGTMRVNGLLNVKTSGKDWVISGDLTHSNNCKIMVNIPASASTATHYNSITYINTENKIVPKREKQEENDISLPMKINVSIWFDPSMTIGAVFNPATGDVAQVTGNGTVKLVYDLNTAAMSLLGDYEVEAGTASLSLAGITKKTFTVKEGGKLVFHGDPFATTFNLTALYNLRASLSTLDPSFASTGNAKVPVTCSLTATGNLDEMELTYAILLPGESEDVQRNLNGLLYTDDLKIREIAYLLAFGSFLPTAGNTGDKSGILVNSISAITSGGLNKLLSGVLADNWTIGTDIRTSDTSFNDVAMDVNVSTRLFDDRLTINGTLGYHNNAYLTNNFTGDFTIEYKLVPSGNLLLKAYNVTNNQYYEQAITTQGAGVVYRREARTFKKLFEKIVKKSKK